MTIKKIDYDRCISCSYPVDTTLDTFVIDLDTYIIKSQEKAACQVACPAGVHIPAFLYLLQQGRIEEAIKLLRESLPFPAVTGHVCLHPCESECARKEVDEPLNINSLERFIADYWGKKEEAKPIPLIHEKKVAIAGSGPAGLSAAYFLVKAGYFVTVFESMPAPGGMLRYGIPEYRLPRVILDEQINYIKNMGVNIRTGVTVGGDITLEKLQNDGYKATILAVGAQLSRKLKLEGIGLDGVLWGLDFLRDVNLKHEIKIRDKVLVVGGGDVAVDAARTALRLAADKVTLVYRRTKEEMPAYKEGMEEAEAEGVQSIYLASPTRIVGKNGKVVGMECIRMEASKPGEGRKSLVPIQGSEFVIDADMIIIAIGQSLDLSFFPEGVKMSREETIEAHPITLETALQGVFACGDAISGPTSVVKAIASGKAAAISVDRYLQGNLTANKEDDIKKVEKPPKEGVKKKDRQVTPLLPLEQRKGNFREVKTGFEEEIAVSESKRCMACGIRGNCTEVCTMDVLRMDDYLHKPIIRYPEDCMTCYNCEFTCPMGAISVDPIKREIIPIIDYTSGVEND